LAYSKLELLTQLHNVNIDSLLISGQLIYDNVINFSIVSLEFTSTATYSDDPAAILDITQQHSLTTALFSWLKRGNSFGTGLYFNKVDVYDSVSDAKFPKVLSTGINIGTA